VICTGIHCSVVSDVVQGELVKVAVLDPVELAAIFSVPASVIVLPLLPKLSIVATEVPILSVVPAAQEP